MFMCRYLTTSYVVPEERLFKARVHYVICSTTLNIWQDFLEVPT